MQIGSRVKLQQVIHGLGPVGEVWGGFDPLPQTHFPVAEKCDSGWMVDNGSGLRIAVCRMTAKRLLLKITEAIAVGIVAAGGEYEIGEELYFPRILQQIVVAVL